MRYGMSAPNRRMGRGRNMKTRTYLAELLGTFLFMMLGYASVAGIPNASAPAPNLLVVPFAFGFGLLAAIFSFGGRAFFLPVLAGTATFFFFSVSLPSSVCEHTFNRRVAPNRAQGSSSAPCDRARPLCCSLRP